MELKELKLPFVIMFKYPYKYIEIMDVYIMKAIITSVIAHCYADLQCRPGTPTRTCPRHPPRRLADLLAPKALLRRGVRRGATHGVGVPCAVAWLCMALLWGFE